MKYRSDYSHKAYYEDLVNTFEPIGLIQLVDFVTWRRLVEGTWRTSVMDHVYSNDLTIVSNLTSVDTIIGDHVLVTMTMAKEDKVKPLLSYMRDWTNYTKDGLLTALSTADFHMDIRLQNQSKGKVHLNVI